VDDCGATSFNRYHFFRTIGGKFYDFKPAIKKVYIQSNPLALREWHWDDYKTIPGVNDDYHNAFDKYENYVELSAKKQKKWKVEDKRLTEFRSPISYAIANIEEGCRCKSVFGFMKKKFPWF
jgi:hypothetical protein